MKRIPGTAFLLFFLTLACVLFLHSDKWRGGNWKHTIGSDGKGYYGYLPAVFIYGDLNYGFAPDYEKKYYENYSQGAYFAAYINGKYVNKYFAGVAVLMAPFFLLALLLSSLLGYDVDGYSVLFQTGVGISTLFYFIAGLWMLRNILKTYGVPEWICMLSVTVIGLGTNLLYYTLVEPSMSHTYSFFAFTLFIYFARLLFSGFTRGRFYGLAVSFALILLIRPSNGLVLLSLPFLAGDRETFVRFVRECFSRISRVFIAGGICIAFLFIQALLYYFACGQWWVDTYIGEHFDFLHPEILNVLFSYRKGLFVYTPILIICLSGIIVLFRRQRFAAWTFAGFFAIVLWVVSSWWSWWYGGSFGMRSMIEYFPFFAILYATGLMNFPVWFRVVLSVPVAAFLFLNLLQSYQAYRLILPWDGMDKVKYWRIFLKTDKKYQNMLLPPDGGPPIPPGAGKAVFFNDMEGGTQWMDMHTVSGDYAFSGKYSSKMEGDQKKSVTFLKTLSECIPDSAKEVILNVKFRAMMTNLESDAFLVIHVQRGSDSPMYHGYPLFHMVWEADKWINFERAVKLPHALAGDYNLNVYVLKNDTTAIYLDDVELTFWYK
ncbi:MAG: hypothetical protein IT233_00335 [Bacteroidia bacterium]|nr:hypothetical protein [Bacteroidia bacterium]